MSGPGAGGGYRIVARPESFTSTAAAFLARKLAALGSTGPVNVALSGGTTPGPVYERLAQSPLPPWDRLDIFFADDRAVPRDHPDSNYRLVRETLIEPAGIAEERVHPMVPDGWSAPSGSEDTAGVLERLDPLATRYATELPPRFDLVLLGLGGDGHTASIFPDSDVAGEETRRVTPAVAPFEPRFRLTITPPEILRARLVVVLVRGKEKREAVRRSLVSGSTLEVPGRLANRGIWLLDLDAVEVGA